MNKIFIKEKIDNSIYSLYNSAANLIFYLGRKDRELTKRNIDLKNIHLGERCFILGTGPSLKELNPKYIKEEITFGVNFLHKSDLINEISPNYYCLFDNIFYSGAKESMKEIIELLPNTRFFLRTKAFDVVKELGLKSNNIYYQHCNLYQYGDLIQTDMTKNMTAPFNVVLACIQSAIYMGFKEIYLLGCDFNSFASLKVEHCYDKDNSPDRQMLIGFELKFYSIVSYHHYALAKYARENNIGIYNLTPNSLLDAYERRSLEELL